MLVEKTLSYLVGYYKVSQTLVVCLVLTEAGHHYIHCASIKNTHFCFFLYLLQK